MKQFWVLSLCTLITLASCGSDDDDGVTQISLEEQNTQDDGAIITFLKSYYFDELGRVTEFDADDDSDDNETPLHDIAIPLESGVWYVKNDAVIASGPAVTNEDTQTILLNYNFQVFSSINNEGEYNYGSLVSYASTTSTTGLPSWDIPFFRKDLDEDSTYEESYYEMEGFQEAIKFFNSTEKALDELYTFQGAIIVPSRMNYARDANYYQMYNGIAVINFELYQVQDDE